MLDVLARVEAQPVVGIEPLNVLIHESVVEIGQGQSQCRLRLGNLLGAPRPGWSHTIEKSGRSYETWYYKRTDGGVASITFVDDTIVTVRPSGNAPELRCYVEAKTDEKAQALLAEMLERLRAAVGAGV